MRLGKHVSKKDAVEAALRHYIQHLGQCKILELFGTIDYDPDYDYKKGRQRRRIPEDFEE
jgi:hypothetical protein